MTNFGEQINKELKAQFPENPKSTKSYTLDMTLTRLNQNTFKLTIETNGQISVAKMRIEEGQSIDIPIRVNFEQ